MDRQTLEAKKAVLLKDKETIVKRLQLLQKKNEANVAAINEWNGHAHANVGALQVVEQLLKEDEPAPEEDKAA